MNHSQVCHRWAHGRDGRGANMTSRDGRLYSYSTCIAELTESRIGRVALFSSTSYSVSTSKHQSHAARAIPAGVPILRVPGRLGADQLAGFISTPANCRELFDWHLEQSTRAAGEAERARLHKAVPMRTQLNHVRQAALVARIAGRRWKTPEIETLQNAISERQAVELTARDEAWRTRDARRVARDARKAERERERLADALQSWRAGGPSRCFYSVPIEFRLVHDGRDIETTRGAVFPASEARRALSIAYRIRARGETWTAPAGGPVRVGIYHMDRVDGDGITAGCHSMKWPEIDQFCQAQGWSFGTTESGAE